MHAIHPDPRRLLAAAGAALALILATLALPSAAGDLHLRLTGGPERGTASPSPAVVRHAPAQPRWVVDPLSPPALQVR